MKVAQAQKRKEQRLFDDSSNEDSNEAISDEFASSIQHDELQTVIEEKEIVSDQGETPFVKSRHGRSKTHFLLSKDPSV